MRTMRREGLVFPLLILVAINILNFYDRHVAGALAEPMRKEFDLTDTQIGLLGSIFTWLYAIVGVPLGRLADVWSRKKLLAWGIVIWTSLTAYAGLATSYTGLVISRLGVAVGESVAAPAATSWIGDIFPPTKRARALAIFMLGVPVGGALSYFLSGPVAQAYGWRVAMVLAALPALLLIPALMMLHEPKRGASEAHAVHAKQTGSMWAVLRIPTLWWIIASGVFVNFNMYAIGTFLPAFLSRIHGFTLAESGVYTGVVYLIGGVSGAMLAGMWGDRISQRRKDGRLLSAAFITSLAAPAALAGILLPQGWTLLVIVALALAYAALNSYYGLVYSSIQDIVQPGQRGTTMAIYFMLMYMCGASFGPYLTGRLSDMLAIRAAEAAGSGIVTETFKAIGLQQAMLCIPVLSVCLGVVLWAGSRTVARDMDRREAALIAAAQAS
jgi:predicted MFS family arabinose efflux permease